MNNISQLTREMMEECEAFIHRPLSFDDYLRCRKQAISELQSGVLIDDRSFSSHDSAASNITSDSTSFIQEKLPKEPMALQKTATVSSKLNPVEKKDITSAVFKTSEQISTEEINEEKQNESSSFLAFVDNIDD